MTDLTTESVTPVLLMCLLFMATSTIEAASQDQYEPDDSSEFAAPVFLNDVNPQRHNFHKSDDQDWVQFLANRDVPLEIQVTNFGPLSDIVLVLYDSNGIEIRRRDDGANGEGERLSWQAPEDGIYYVEILPYDNSLFVDQTDYELKIFMPIAEFGGPDLKLTHSLDSIVTVGKQFALTLLVTNDNLQLSDDVVTNVLTKTKVPSGMSVKEGLTANCNVVSSVITCDIGDLLSGESNAMIIPLVASDEIEKEFFSSGYGYLDKQHENAQADDNYGNNSTITRISPLQLEASDGGSQGFVIDTSVNAPITGLWWNQNESGWGITLTQQFGIIFATVFTYDSSRLPKWYVASNCTVTDNGCTGLLYEVTGGSAISSDWNNAETTVNQVGEITVSFQDNDNGVMILTIDGATTQKTITRQVFSIPSPGAPYTALWYNEAESGWGVTVTQQTDISFVTIFTYDENGLPIWYVASNCADQGNGCSGELYEITGGSAMTDQWKGLQNPVKKVGEVTFEFTSIDTGIMNFTISGIAGSKAISRQIWATE